MQDGAAPASPDPHAALPLNSAANFHVGGVSVAVKGHCQADIAMVPPLALFRSRPTAPDISVRVERVESLVPAAKRQVFDSGSTWRLYDADGGLQFDFAAPFFGEQPYKRLFVDGRFRRATLQLNQSCAPRSSYPGVALSYPLDELLIMHRLTQEKAIELHGCGIVRPDGTGNLFVGHSGAGKSTTTRLWTSLEEVEVLSDDRIIVRRDEGRGAPRHSAEGAVVEMPFGAAGDAGGRGVLRLRDCSASRTNRFALDDKPQDDKSQGRIPHHAFGPARNDSGMRMYGTPWHGEAMYASPNSAGLDRIFVLEHGIGNLLTRLSPSQAVAELFARSFVPFHRHEYVESALEFLQELVDSVPVYRYSFEPDERAVEKIMHFRD